MRGTGSSSCGFPGAQPGSKFTALFERLAIDLLRECAVTGAGPFWPVTWDEAWGIRGRAVRRGRVCRPVRLDLYPHEAR